MSRHNDEIIMDLLKQELKLGTCGNQCMIRSLELFLFKSLTGKDYEPQPCKPAPVKARQQSKVVQLRAERHRTADGQTWTRFTRKPDKLQRVNFLLATGAITPCNREGIGFLDWLFS